MGASMQIVKLDKVKFVKAIRFSESKDSIKRISGVNDQLEVVLGLFWVIWSSN